MSHANLWISFNNLCAMMMSLCYLAGLKSWTLAFSLGIAVSALMAETLLIPYIK